MIRESGLAIIVLELELELSHQCVVKNSQNTVKTAKMTIGVPIVTCLPRLYQQCTNRQKQSKDSQNSKNDHWCTINRHVYTESAEYTKSASASKSDRLQNAP